MLGFKKNTPKVFDYSAKKRFWGHNFKLQTKLDDEGYKWVIAIWNEHMPNPGDFILLGLNNSETTTAIIKKVEPCGNPSDMYFLKIDIRNSKNKFESTKEVIEC